MLLTHTLEIQQKRAERRRALPANSWLVRHLIPEGATASLHLSALPWRRLPTPRSAREGGGSLADATRDLRHESPV